MRIFDRCLTRRQTAIHASSVPMLLAKPPIAHLNLPLSRFRPPLMPPRSCIRSLPEAIGANSGAGAGAGAGSGSGSGAATSIAFLEERLPLS